MIPKRLSSASVMAKFQLGRRRNFRLLPTFRISENVMLKYSVMKIIIAIQVALATLSGTVYLANYFVWGSAYVPPNAKWDEILSLEGWYLASFLILLALPKILIYFYSPGKRRWKIVIYLILPFLVWLSFSGFWMFAAWYLIAFTAWIEALSIPLPPDHSNPST